MVRRNPAPTLKLSEATVDRPKVEFLIRRRVDVPNDGGDLESVDQTSVELFQVKLHSELTLGDFEEIGRVQGELQDLMDRRAQMETGDWLTKVRFAFRRLLEVAFHDPVPPEAVGGLTLERLEEITDFLLSLLPEPPEAETTQREPAGT